MNSPVDNGCGSHVVDATMFWSPTGGGVRRYLQTKHAWLARQPGWSHTIAVPLADARGDGGIGGDGSGGANGNGGADGGIGVDDSLVGLPSIPLPRSGGYRLPLRRAVIADRLAALAPDLIEAGDPYVIAWAAVDAARRRGVPAVAYCHSNLEQMARLAAGRRFAAAAARAARAYARRVYRRFDLVLAPSASMRAHLLDWGIDRVGCQPLGVDSTAFRPARASAAAWRERMGYAPQSRVLVYAGRFAAEKHLDVLAAAVRRLGAPYALLAIGAGPKPPSGERVRVLPFVAGIDELAAAFASADAFVHAGDQETFGLSVLEAMACGTPIVARRAEGLAELVDDTVGIGVESNRPADYAEAIAALFASDIEAKRHAARARAEAHDWERELPALLTHYRRLLRGTDATAVAASESPTGAVHLR